MSSQLVRAAQMLSAAAALATRRAVLMLSSPLLLLVSVQCLPAGQDPRGTTRRPRLLPSAPSLNGLLEDVDGVVEEVGALLPSMTGDAAYESVDFVGVAGLVFGADAVGQEEFGGWVDEEALGCGPAGGSNVVSVQ